MILINPYFDRTQKLGIFAHYVPLSVPMGIGALAGYFFQRNGTLDLKSDIIGHNLA